MLFFFISIVRIYYYQMPGPKKLAYFKEIGPGRGYYGSSNVLKLIPNADSAGKQASEAVPFPPAVCLYVCPLRAIRFGLFSTI